MYNVVGVISRDELRFVEVDTPSGPFEVSDGFGCLMNFLYIHDDVK